MVKEKGIWYRLINFEFLYPRHRKLVIMMCINSVKFFILISKFSFDGFKFKIIRNTGDHKMCVKLNMAWDSGL